MKFLQIAILETKLKSKQGNLGLIVLYLFIQEYVLLCLPSNNSERIERHDK